MAKHSVPNTDETFDDAEVINAMLSAGQRLADEAADKHASGKYSALKPGSPEHHQECRAGYYRWQAMKSRMRELAQEMGRGGVLST